MTALAAVPVAVPLLREVRLYGRLGRQFGRVFRLAVQTPAEAARALCALLPGFRQALLGPDGRGAYHVFVGRGQRRHDIGEEEVQASVGSADVIRFVPVVEGAKRAGVLQTVVGIALIAYGVFGGGGPVFTQAGVAMLLGGVIQLLSPQRKKEERKPEGQTSYAFDGPVNITEQGGPVPVALGRVICGSTVVSQGLSTVQIVAPAPAPLPEPPVPDDYANWSTGGDGTGGIGAGGGDDGGVGVSANGDY